MKQALLAAALVVLAGCSSTEAGSPAPPTQADPIPAVQQPKDITGIAPCDLLTGEQLPSAGFDQPGGPEQFEEISGVPSCLWRDSADTRRLTAAAILDRDALRNLYQYQRQTYQVLELTEVAGHPAVRTQVLAGGTKCKFDVATAVGQSLEVAFTSYDGTPPCPEAERIAALVIGNLPPAS
ncbi:MAG: DUF3558 domain-containing protein [Actinomycetota bacterium]|nr:DUF3558 domain-containing protein [Actinomycetota bacterium]